MGAGTIPGLLSATRAANPRGVAYRAKRQRAWQDITWADNEAQCRRISKALMALGVRPGDRVAVMSETRVEWVQTDLGITGCGGTTVGIYPTSPPSDCAYVLDHSEAVVAFVESRKQLGRISALRKSLPLLRSIVLFEGEGDPPNGILGWREFLDLAGRVADADLDRRLEDLAADDLASIVYTSGTTGIPKGAMLTHRNILSAAESAGRALAVGSGRTMLLFLPLAHVFARLTVHLCLRTSNTVAFAGGLHAVADDLRETRPHFFAGVPRFYEKIHDKIRHEAQRAGGAKARIFQWGLGVGTRASTLERQGRQLPPALALQRFAADRLVFRRIHAALGGRVDFLISGAAPLDPKVAEFFHACGVLILEGIGMTENASFSNVNRPSRFKFGTVGPLGPGMDIRIAPDGEIHLRGPNVMKGYFKDPEGTARAIDPDGWLLTGDVGEMDSDGFLRITDRKKDLIVTSGGKNVAPQRIEKALTSSPYIAQAVVFGDGKKYIAALLGLDADAVRDWAARTGKPLRDGVELGLDPEVRFLVQAEVERVNRELPEHEAVRKFRVLPSDLSVESGELTPTLKVRRKVVAEKYGPLLEEMYHEGMASVAVESAIPGPDRGHS